MVLLQQFRVSTTGLEKLRRGFPSKIQPMSPVKPVTLQAIYPPLTCQKRPLLSTHDSAAVPAFGPCQERDRRRSGEGRGRHCEHQQASQRRVEASGGYPRQSRAPGESVVVSPFPLCCCGGVTVFCPEEDCLALPLRNIWRRRKGQIKYQYV